MLLISHINLKVLTVILIAALVPIAGCGGSKTTSEDTPTAAYKRLYSAVKSKDIESIKLQVTKKTVSMAEMSAQRFGKPLDQAYENGFTATTFSNTLPSMRDERIKGDMGAVEVWNAKDSKWEDLPFILEDGTWKLAMGDAFAGSYQSPGKGRDFREREAANAVSNSKVIILGNNANSPGNMASNSK
ncbi:hypothetical protein BH20ACI2_BH20ACI2_17280 [soil metagenome]